MIQFIVKSPILEEDSKLFKAFPGHCVAEFEELTKEERQNLKQKYPKGYFRLSFWEQGGANFDDGKAYVVSGTDGEKLKPVKVRKKGWLANSRHALFTGTELCVVEATQEKRSIVLKLVKYIIRANGDLIEEELWEGSKEKIDFLPETLKKYEEVLQAACQKSLEYRCLYPMYYIPK